MDSLHAHKKNTEVQDAMLDWWDYTKEPLQISECHGSARSTEMALLTIKWDDLVEQFRKPGLGPKDGSYICRCAFSDNHRHDVSHLPSYLLILDGDSSYDPDTGEAVTGAPDPHEVHEFLYEQDITHSIYSSHSNQQDNKGHRYRILIPVNLEGQEDLDACVAWLVNCIQASGIPLADVKENHTFAQAWYRPRIPNEKAREAYVFLEHDGLQPFPLKDAREWHREQQILCQSVETADHNTAVKEMDAESPIARFNAKVHMTGMSKMLEDAGYIYRSLTSVNNRPARRYLHPDSTSGEAGVVLFESKVGIFRVHSHHGDYDPLSGRAEDPFGVFTLLVHSGDHDAALKAAIFMLKQNEADPAPVVDLDSLAIAANPAVKVARWFREEHLPDGLVGDVARYCLRSVPVPNPLYAVGAGLMAISLFSRNRFLVEPLATTLNLYAIEVGLTAAGKEGAPKTIKRLASEVQAENWITDDVSSGVALQRALYEAPDHCLMFWRDEIWELLMAARGFGGAQHARSTVSTLLTAYSAADGVFAGKKYSDSDRNIPAFNRPFLVFGGATTPERFTEALSSKHIADGFLNRLIVLQDKGTPADINWQMDTNVPQDLKDGLKGLFQPKYPAVDAMPQGMQKIAVGYESMAALQYLQDFMRKSRQLSIEDPKYGPLWNRAGENAIKVAGILAVGANPVKPEISQDQAKWAVWLIEHTMQAFAVTLEEHLSESKFDKQCKKARKLINDAWSYNNDQKWGYIARHNIMARSLLVRLMHVTARELNDIVEHLIDSDQIEKVECKSTAGKSITAYRMTT